MQSKDMLSAEEFTLLREALEASFQELVKAHDVQLSVSLASWQDRQRAEKAGAPEAELDAKREQAMHHHYVADVLKALVWARYPAGALDWFGREEA